MAQSLLKWWSLNDKITAKANDNDKPMINDNQWYYYLMTSK